jgi:hypothetical protein
MLKSSIKSSIEFVAQFLTCFAAMMLFFGLPGIVQQILQKSLTF